MGVLLSVRAFAGQLLPGWSSIVYNDTNRRGPRPDNIYYYFYPYHNHMLDGTSFITATPTEHVAHLPQPLLQPLGLHIARLSPWTDSRGPAVCGTYACVSDDGAVQGFGAVQSVKLWKVTGRAHGYVDFAGRSLQFNVSGKSSRGGTGGGVTWYCRWWCGGGDGDGDGDARVPVPRREHTDGGQASVCIPTLACLESSGRVMLLFDNCATT